MRQPHPIRLSSWARLVALSLLLGFGLLAGSLLTSRPAHAQPLSSTTITNCADDSQLQNAVNSASSGDTIAFGCSGDIKLSQTLTIATNLTLDGSGQSVTLDGGNSVRVLLVDSGVSFTLKVLTVAHGTTAGNGGGLDNNGGTVSISNSTFANNSAAFGGGLFNGAGTVSISNSTVAGNSSTDLGGGLGLGGGGTVSISNSTVAGNGAPYGGGLFIKFGTVNIGGSIVADNTSGDCNSPLTDQGYNLESGTDCGFTGTGDLQNTNPKLDPSGLQSNGGPTQTIALQSDSPAIDHIPAAQCPKTDQRGVTRQPGERCDIGAFEFPDTTAPTLNLPGTITVNANSSGVAVVTYTATATDDDGDTLAATCAPASGSTFSIGTTMVNCSASEPGSNTASGSFQVVVVDDDLGLTNMPTNITTNATSPQGAVVTYTSPTATDESGDNPAPSVSCTPTSGSTFPISTTKVTCTATDSDDANSPVSHSFQVVVQDKLPPSLQLPSSPVTANATSPQGAAVTYAVTATDPVYPSNQLTINCTPASGSTFAIGTTTVNCTTSDPAGNSTTGSFPVVVKGAAAQVSDLVSLVNSFNLSKSLQTTLDNKLQDVLTAIKAGQTATACSELTDFIGHVQSQSGKGLTVSQATQLIAAAKQVQAVLGC